VGSPCLAKVAGRTSSECRQHWAEVMGVGWWQRFLQVLREEAAGQLPAQLLCL